jgi:molybdopterin converting factor small subunit
MGGDTVRILIASPLRPYTGADEVDVRGATLGELLDDLDRRFPGIRFRIVDEQEKIRRHMRFFINGEPVFSLGHPVRSGDEVAMVQALSGG